MNSQTIIFRFDVMLNDWPYWTHQCRSENKMFVHWILINLKVKIFIDQTYDLVRLGYDGILLRLVSFCLVWPFKYYSIKKHIYNCWTKLLLPYWNPINHVESSGHHFTISFSLNYPRPLTHDSPGPGGQIFHSKIFSRPHKSPWFSGCTSYSVFAVFVIVIFII